MLVSSTTRETNLRQMTCRLVSTTRIQFTQLYQHCRQTVMYRTVKAKHSLSQYLDFNHRPQELMTKNTVLTSIVHNSEFVFVRRSLKSLRSAVNFLIVDWCLLLDSLS